MVEFHSRSHAFRYGRKNTNPTLVRIELATSVQVPTINSPLGRRASLQQRWQSPQTVDPRLLPSGNPFKYHVEALSLRPMKQYIITTMFDHVLHSVVSVLFSLFVWCPCMAINVVSVQYNGGLLPDIILLTQCYYHRGTRLNAMKSFLWYLQPIISPKRFAISPPD